MFRLKLVFATGAGFSNIPGEYENVIFIIKNPQNSRNGFILKLHSWFGTYTYLFNHN